jgi:hypothetical protein
MRISRHTAADCPVNNPENLKVAVEGLPQMETLAKKHGVKIIGTWDAHLQHLFVQVVEAPNFEAYMAMWMEPPLQKLLHISMNEITPVFTLPEVEQVLKQRMQQK